MFDENQTRLFYDHISWNIDQFWNHEVWGVNRNWYCWTHWLSEVRNITKNQHCDKGNNCRKLRIDLPLSDCLPLTIFSGFGWLLLLAVYFDFFLMWIIKCQEVKIQECLVISVCWCSNDWHHGIHPVTLFNNRNYDVHDDWWTPAWYWSASGALPVLFQPVFCLCMI